jgi:KH domain
MLYDARERLQLCFWSCSLLHPLCAGAALKFELAVGLNGRVWVTAPDTVATIMVANAIQHSEPLSDTQAHIFVKVRYETPQWTAMPLTASFCKRPGYQSVQALYVLPVHHFLEKQVSLISPFGRTALQMGMYWATTSAAGTFSARYRL